MRPFFSFNNCVSFFIFRICHQIILRIIPDINSHFFSSEQYFFKYNAELFTPASFAEKAVFGIGELERV